VEEKNMAHHLTEAQTPKVSTPKQVKNTNLYEKLSEKNKIIFLAGLFDGEGSFGLWSKGKGASKPKYFAASVETTDEDMVKRFYDMFGGTFYPCKQRKSHWKTTYRWKICGKGAFLCMDKMIDYMCLRRQEKYYVAKCN
tara:strand:- start:50 stop:466 length:417 start_codon:yes stop_codon:yes gene_type:complete